jgi:rhodanese-related sulfurtransferase
VSVGQPSPIPRGIDEVLAEARAGLDRVGARQAADMQAAGALLVDIRPGRCRAARGEIPGAVVVERNVLEWRLDPTCDARLEGIDADIYQRDVIVVCNEGYASSLAAADLQRLGFRRVTDLAGGFEAWLEAGLPVSAGSDPPAGT